MLIDQCQKIDINQFIQTANHEYKKRLIKSHIEALGQQIQLTSTPTRFEGQRLWFICPLCEHRVGNLYQHPIKQIVGCRNCLQLKYRNQRYKGMIENNI